MARARMGLRRSPRPCCSSKSIDALAVWIDRVAADGGIRSILIALWPCSGGSSRLEHEAAEPALYLACRHCWMGMDALCRRRRSWTSSPERTLAADERLVRPDVRDLRMSADGPALAKLRWPEGFGMAAVWPGCDARCGGSHCTCGLASAKPVIESDIDPLRAPSMSRWTRQLPVCSIGMPRLSFHNASLIGFCQNWTNHFCSQGSLPANRFWYCAKAGARSFVA